MKSVGLHYTQVAQGEHDLMGTLFNPFIAKKGRIVSFYLLSEYGLGYHYKRDLFSETSTVRYHVSLEFLRIRVARFPMYIHLTGTYEITNKLLQKEPIEIGYFGGLRYYFYRGK
ncbi:MAG: hypothetical protein MK078_02670 [Crocinitomicaceae bacterium]|nr:hypothetical protein [Crocinitomicaceae bacterium]